MVTKKVFEILNYSNSVSLRPYNDNLFIENTTLMQSEDHSVIVVESFLY